MRKSILLIALLILGLVVMGMLCPQAFGEESGTEGWRSIGIIALKDGSGPDAPWGEGYYLGLLYRSVIPIYKTVANLIELGIAVGVTSVARDNDIELIEGFQVFYFPADRLKSYLGIGTGFCRYADWPGGATYWTIYDF